MKHETRNPVWNEHSLASEHHVHLENGVLVGLGEEPGQVHHEQEHQVERLEEPQTAEFQQTGGRQLRPPERSQQRDLQHRDHAGPGQAGKG